MSELIPLDEKVLTDFLLDRYGVSLVLLADEAQTIAKAISQRFGQPRVPSAEDIELTLSKCKAWQALWLHVPAEVMENAQPLIAEAIALLIGKDGKNEQ